MRDSTPDDIGSAEKHKSWPTFDLECTTESIVDSDYIFLQPRGELSGLFNPGLRSMQRMLYHSKIYHEYSH